jgi:AcrR family transcriptional regulator
MSNISEEKDPVAEVSAANPSVEKAAEMSVKGKRNATAEETRERILDAAQHLFAMHGFNATPVKAIAEKAEVPNSLIFYYFPTKRALLESLIQERNRLPKLHAVMDVPHDAGIRSILIHIGTHYLETSRKNPEVPYILLREFRSHDDVAVRFEAFREELIQLMASYLAKARDAGELQIKKGNVQIIARMFMYNLIVAAIIARYPEKPEQFVEEVVDVLLCGLVSSE